ncbi:MULTISPECIES: hypothetical protein [unclassified Chelatococcus]|uniref:hypothetical protein n=1 Tax=unclassified Chelatococcus TaxID=2638111 RepID=UPI001BD0C40D|nr:MULTISPECIES: hypothetical protein [unclassified Chelatococcus]MBS7738193.1 hypothetical protein [Chelatococcus sp. HY11]MBX3545721.1 hypothetical protein [Chelatococcus sp.]MCO5077461.1 hypothetical protein [Chelatococcus sp.]
MKIIAFLVPIVLLAGCGGREAHPVAATSPTDATSTCSSLLAEYQANATQISTKIGERATNNGKNAVVGVGGLLFPPALFFMDLKSYEKAEVEALEARNRVLIGLMEAKRC